MKRKYKQTAPIITTVAGIILIISSYLIDKFITSGFIYNVNSDTFGVGLALTVAGIIWFIKREIKD